MKKKYYLPDADYEREIWMNTFYTGVAGLPAAWDIDATQITSLLNDRNAFRYSLVFQEAVNVFCQTCTASKQLLKSGPKSLIPQAFPVFVPPAGMPLIAVTSGIFNRVTQLVGQLKKNDLYNEAVGKILGVIGSEIVVDYSTLRPALTLSFEGGHIHLKYLRGKTDGIMLYCMRGTETTFTLLTTITKTIFNDTRPNLEVGQAETRQYRAFFMVSDVAVGVESLVVSISC